MRDAVDAGRFVREPLRARPVAVEDPVHVSSSAVAAGQDISCRGCSTRRWPRRRRALSGPGGVAGGGAAPRRRWCSGVRSGDPQGAAGAAARRRPGRPARCPVACRRGHRADGRGAGVMLARRAAGGGHGAVRDGHPGEVQDGGGQIEQAHDAGVRRDGAAGQCARVAGGGQRRGQSQAAVGPLRVVTPTLCRTELLRLAGGGASGRALLSGIAVSVPDHRTRPATVTAPERNVSAARRAPGANAGGGRGAAPPAGRAGREVGSRHIVALGGLRVRPGVRADRVLRAGADREAGPRVCYLPTARGDQAEGIVQFHTRLAGTPAECTHLALFDRTVRDLRGFLLGQDAIWVGGGNTANMLAVWRVHGVDRVLREAWEAGVLLRRRERRVAVLVRVRDDRLVRPPPAGAAAGRTGAAARLPLPPLRRRGAAPAALPPPRRRGLPARVRDRRRRGGPLRGYGGGGGGERAGGRHRLPGGAARRAGRRDAAGGPAAGLSAGLPGRHVHSGRTAHRLPPTARARPGWRRPGGLTSAIAARAPTWPVDDLAVRLLDQPVDVASSAAGGGWPNLARRRPRRPAAFSPPTSWFSHSRALGVRARRRRGEAGAHLHLHAPGELERHELPGRRPATCRPGSGLSPLGPSRLYSLPSGILCFGTSPNGTSLKSGTSLRIPT